MIGLRPKTENEYDSAMKLIRNIQSEELQKGEKCSLFRAVYIALRFLGNHRGMIKTKETEKEVNGEIITEQIEEITDYYKEPEHIKNLQVRLNNSMKSSISRTNLTRKLWDDILNIIDKENDDYQINPKNAYDDMQKYINILKERYIAEKTL